jgi:hypothetical protein
MNVFQPYNFPLASGNTDAAPVNHPALVKTNDQPSFCSFNFSPFTSADAKSELNPNPRGGTGTGGGIFHCTKNILRQLRKRI